jgi:hypothetical protein
VKYLLSCLLLTLLCILQVNAQEKSERDFENLTGPVHRVRVERALVTCDSGKCNEGKRILSIADTYDLKGNLVSSNRNRYDPKNPLLRLTHYPFGDEPAVVQTHKVTPFGDAYTYTFIFDDLARRSEWLTFLADGSFEGKAVYLFNSDGKLVEQISYESDLQVSDRTTHSYDEKGNEIVQTAYGKTGSIICVQLFDYEFDEIGNWIKQVRTIKKPHNGEMNVVWVAVYYRTIVYHRETSWINASPCDKCRDLTVDAGRAHSSLQMIA